MSEEALLSPDDAFGIGHKIVEMADRVKVGHAIVPGTQAKWGFVMDGTRFQVVVTVAKDHGA